MSPSPQKQGTLPGRARSRHHGIAVLQTPSSSAHWSSRRFSNESRRTGRPADIPGYLLPLSCLSVSSHWKLSCPDHTGSRGDDTARPPSTDRQGAYLYIQPLPLFKHTEEITRPEANCREYVLSQGSSSTIYVSVIRFLNPG